MRSIILSCLLLSCLMVPEAVHAVEEGAEGDATFERPLIARPATTTRKLNMDVYGTYVDGLALQEAKDFRGWTVGLDFTLPISRWMQLRLLMPVRTEGKAVITAGDIDSDIKGWSGIFDFGTLFFEHQLTGRDGGPGRFAYSLGLGWRTGVLETDTPDKYNHQGRNALLGVRYERRFSGGSTALLDAQYRYYEVSDDLNPASLHHDTFNFIRLTGTWMGPRRGVFRPAVELNSEFVPKGYIALSIVPEVFFRPANAFEIKVGVAAGLTSDAPDWGTEMRATILF